MRLFVGLAIPQDIRSRLAALTGGIPGARWVAAESIHLSLRFIGEVPGGAERDIDAALAAVGGAAFALRLSGLGCFERRGRVHALWAGIEKQAALMALQDRVESAVVREGFDPERRKFKPHVTLARMKNGRGPEVGRYLENHGDFRAGPFHVDHFTLFRSHLGRGGAHYEALAEYPLKP